MSASRPNCRRCAVRVRPSAVRSRLPWRSSRQPWPHGSPSGAAKAARGCGRRGSPRRGRSERKSTSSWARDWCGAASPASTVRARCCWIRQRGHARSCRVNCWAARPRGDRGMLLAIDVGNTNSKFAMFDGDKIVAQWRLRTEAKRTADEYAAWLTQLMDGQGFDPKPITGAILASVVPTLNQHIRRLCETYFGNGILIVGEPDCELGIKVLIDRPQEAGADRLVGVIAGHTKYGGPPVTVGFCGPPTLHHPPRRRNFLPAA